MVVGGLRACKTTSGHEVSLRERRVAEGVGRSVFPVTSSLKSTTPRDESFLGGRLSIRTLLKLHAERLLTTLKKGGRGRLFYNLLVCPFFFRWCLPPVQKECARLSISIGAVKLQNAP